MSETLRLGKNSLWLLSARVGAQALMVLFTILLARKLGSVGFGEYAFFAAAIFIGNGLTTFGTDMLLIREIAAGGDFSRLPPALWIQLLLSGLLIAGIVLGAPALPKQSSASVFALQIYSLALIPFAFYTVFTTALRGKQHMDSYALLNLIVALLQVMSLWLLRENDGVVKLAILLLIVQGLAALLAGFLCTRQIPGFWRGWRFSWKDIQAVATASAPLGLLGLLGMFYQKLSLVLLSPLGGAALTGWYSAALRAVEASKTVHLSVFTALYPAMAQADPSGQVAGTIRLSWRLLLAGAFALALGLSLLSTTLVDLLYGVGFAAATPILRILAWMLVPYTVNSFLTLAFVASHRVRAVGWALTASLLGLGLLSLWWIPAYGLEGAAWAALSAECLQAVLLLAQTIEAQKLIQGEAHELSNLS
jgi:PST family polysaccharide transporter